ncbi:MAG: hypothetical protein D4R65_15145 [Verrucomicrobiaceae bacterium]|nr:MAG: hypothetical protein D4R65_15145 [Verrucomicrobiaceae bacterium]
MKNLTVGFVGFGEVNTPREIIERKCGSARAVLAGLGVNLLVTPPVSDDPAGNDVRRAIADLSAKRMDVLVVCIAGWIPSHAVISVISEFKHLPMVLWGLAGYYEGNRLITTADQAGTTALRKTMADLGYRFAYVFDYPGKPSRVEAVKDFLLAVSASRTLQRAKVGMMGYRDMNLYATLCDGVSLKKALGVEIEVFEMLEMVQRAECVAAADVKAVVEKVRREWKFEAPAEPETLEKSARYYLALKTIIEERRFDAVSLIDVDGMKKLLQLPPAMILMLIANELNLPTTPENDTLGSVTQLIVRALTGQAAPYFEFYEFMEDRLLVGVPDYVPAAVVDGDMLVRPTRFGSFSEGVLNVSKVKTGPVTLSRLLQHGHGYAIHSVTGTAVAPRAWEEAGWQQPAPQLPGLEIILDTPVEDFAENVACQHYILSYGDTTKELKAFCRLNQFKFI